MSYLIATPGIVQAAAADVASIGSSLSEVFASAAAPTTTVTAAAGDEVSAGIAALFSSHGKAFQMLSAQAAEFHSQFVQALHAGAGAYSSTEAASAGPLQALAQALPARNLAISVGGATLLQSGSATASSGLGDIAIAFGANSNATATGGFLNKATAFGAHSTAVSQGGFNNLATAMGTNSHAQTSAGTLTLASAVGTNSAAATSQGILNTAYAFGTNAAASAGGGNTDTAIALGTNSIAQALNGTSNFADALGDGSTAFAGSTSPTAPGSFTLASVVGTNSTAHASGNLTVFGTGGLAVVFGNTLDADATGNVVINIVTPLFNVAASPFLA
jgi:PE family